jgi:HSP20 family protein
MLDLIPWRRERTRAVEPRRGEPFLMLRRELDDLFDRMFGSLIPTEDWETAHWGLELTPTDKEFVVRAEAPGFEAGDFEVHVTGDVLHIRAERKAKDEKKEEGTFTRSTRLERWVTLPAGTDPEKVEATYRNGVLEIHLPRTPEAVGRKIEVKG